MNTPPALNASLEAKLFFKMIQRGRESVDNVLRQLAVTARQRELLLEGAPFASRGIIQAQIEFRRDVCREFLKLVRKTVQAQTSRT